VPTSRHVDGFRPPDDLLQALAELDPREWEGDAWRHTFAAYAPEKTNLRGARWNPPGVEALYVSLSRETAIAEAEYQMSVQPLRPTAMRTLHRLRVHVYRLLDLTAPGQLATLGATVDDLMGDDHGVCQSIGGAAAFLEVDGILVPSARSRGSNLVILFVDTEPSPSIEVIASEEFRDT
jgi:RES domain-containing protein